MPIKINTFDPNAKTQGSVEDLHEKHGALHATLSELHGKFDALLSLLTPPQPEADAKNEQDKA